MKNIRNKKVERVGLILTILFLVNVVIWLFLDHIAPDNAFPHLLIFGAVAFIFFFCYLIFFAYTIFRNWISPFNNYILMFCFITIIVLFLALWARTGFISF